MNPVHYTHPCGLLFTTERLMSYNEDASHDINIVCLWLPNSAEDPMILVNWYCGEPTLEYTKELADKYIAALKPEIIENLLECQNMDTEAYPDANIDPVKNLIYRLVAVKTHLKMRQLINDSPEGDIDELVRHEWGAIKLLPDLINDLIAHLTK